MMLVSRFVMGACVLLVGVVSALGQPPNMPPGLPPGAEALIGKMLAGPPPLIAIALQKSVQAELKLEKSQKQRMDAMQTKLMGVAMKQMAGGADPAKLLTEIEAQKQATDKELGEILSEEQMVRLKQISLQLQMPQIVLTPEYADELQLTEEQTAKIKKMTHRDDKALASLLTKEQRAKWHEKIGPLFKGKLPELPAGMPMMPRK